MSYRLQKGVTEGLEGPHTVASHLCNWASSSAQQVAFRDGKGRQHLSDPDYRVYVKASAKPATQAPWSMQRLNPIQLRSHEYPEWLKKLNLTYNLITASCDPPNKNTKP